MQGRGRGNRDNGERGVWTDGGVSRSTGKGNAAAWQTKIFVGCICIQYGCVFTAVCVCACACECVCLSLTFWHIYGSFHQPNPCAAFNNNNNNSSNKGNNKLRTHVAYVSLYSFLLPLTVPSLPRLVFLGHNINPTADLIYINILAGCSRISSLLFHPSTAERAGEINSWREMEN